MLSNHPEIGSAETVIRRRPTRRHRRNRLIRRILLVIVCAGLAFGFASIVLQHLSPSLFRASRLGAPDRDTVEASRNLPLLTQQESLRQIENRPVYSYSVVPGGVRDASELKWVVQHDPVVASHYAGFDYDHARVVRLVLARTAYVSYRIGNQVYWTRHRIALKKGETVITDGKITARSRCGNRVEEVPQQATSSLEPPVAKFDEPTMPAVGTGLLNPPVPFESALLNRPAVPGVGPALPLSLYDPFSNGMWVPISPPPLPGVCGVGKKPTGTAATGNKGKGYPCATGGGGGGGVVPEPGTWLLVASGLAAMYWKARQRLART
ncbi:MAG: PEP-CTERM sorting domain-containing protein [Candidatus Sulfotelmatobacter sp.]